MKKIIILISLVFVQNIVAQTSKLNTKKIIKDGTTIKYAIIKLSKSNDEENSIKKKVIDTLKINIIEINNVLQIVFNDTNSGNNKIFIDDKNLNLFTSSIEPKKSKKDLFVDLILSKIQFNQQEIFVDEGLLKPKKYIKIQKQKSKSFLFNGKQVTLPVIFYQEEKQDLEFKVFLTFLETKDFPVLTNLMYITDSQYYFSGTIFKLLSIDTR